MAIALAVVAYRQPFFPGWRTLSNSEKEPPFQGGSQPVKEHASEVPGPGRSVAQGLVLVLGAVVLLAGLMWFFLYAR